mmetsp:Transcript_65107/g.191001  ORF Transcript_65107/g.191001 Transcript_65107/m.191001 type:complete len:206 (-) Transcript_65107:84-701(-)
MSRSASKQLAARAGTSSTLADSAAPPPREPGGGRRRPRRSGSHWDGLVNSARMLFTRTLACSHEASSITVLHPTASTTGCHHPQHLAAQRSIRRIQSGGLSQQGRGGARLRGRRRPPPRMPLPRRARTQWAPRPQRRQHQARRAWTGTRSLWRGGLPPSGWAARRTRGSRGSGSGPRLLQRRRPLPPLQARGRAASRHPLRPPAA